MSTSKFKLLQKLDEQNATKLNVFCFHLTKVNIENLRTESKKKGASSSFYNANNIFTAISHKPISLMIDKETNDKF